MVETFRSNVRIFLVFNEIYFSHFFLFRLRFLVEAGIINHRLNYGLPKAEICPQNLGSIERQLRLNDLSTTYLSMLVGFSTGLLVFIIEVSLSYFALKTVEFSFPDDFPSHEK
jgi:glutamate receptor, ionotropic, invertebrate